MNVGKEKFGLHFTVKRLEGRELGQHKESRSNQRGREMRRPGSPAFI